MTVNITDDELISGFLFLTVDFLFHTEHLGHSVSCIYITDKVTLILFHRAQRVVHGDIQ